MKPRLPALIVLIFPFAAGAAEKAQITTREIPGESRVQIYRLIDNPWPVRDRDYVIEAELFRNSETGEVVIKDQAVEGVLPEVESVVRMKKIREQWTFTPAEPEHVMVTYILKFDPGGGAPAAFINMALSKIGNDLFDGLYRYVAGNP